MKIEVATHKTSGDVIANRLRSDGWTPLRGSTPGVEIAPGLILCVTHAVRDSKDYPPPVTVGQPVEAGASGDPAWMANALRKYQNYPKLYAMAFTLYSVSPEGQVSVHYKIFR